LSTPRVGILAIQGAVDKHVAALERVGAEGRPVRHARDLEGLVALVLPGGESTTIAKGIDRLALREPLLEFAKQGGALLGTCAGAILLARESRNHPVPTLGLIDVVAHRNAYGTQLDSFISQADAGAAEGFDDLPCVFIRAPRLEVPAPAAGGAPAPAGGAGPRPEVLVRVDGAPVLIRQGRVLVSTFHPELREDPRVHAHLLALAAA